MSDSDFVDKINKNATPDLASDFLPALKSNPESFPVLKAFNDILDAERERARRKLVAVSLAGIVSVLIVVMGFLTAGAVIIGRMSSRNDELQSIVMKSAVRDAVVSVPQHSEPSEEEQKTIKELLRINAALNERLDEFKKIQSNFVSLQEKVLSKDKESTKKAPIKIAQTTAPRTTSAKAPPAPTSSQTVKLSIPEPVEANPAVVSRSTTDITTKVSQKKTSANEITKKIDITAPKMPGADGGLDDGLVPAPVMLKTERGILIPWRTAIPK